MADKKQHGGPRPNSGGTRAGAGRKSGPHRPAVRLYVPVENQEEASAFHALKPTERRIALLEYLTRRAE